MRETTLYAGSSLGEISFETTTLLKYFVRLYVCVYFEKEKKKSQKRLYDKPAVAAAAAPVYLPALCATTIYVPLFARRRPVEKGPQSVCLRVAKCT